MSDKENQSGSDKPEKTPPPEDPLPQPTMEVRTFQKQVADSADMREFAVKPKDTKSKPEKK